MDILSNLCAICLNSNTGNLCTTSTISYDVSYAEKLKICIPEYVSEHFDLRQCCLCERCVTQLDDFYKFLTTAMESKVRLEEMIVENVRVKREVEEEFIEVSRIKEECNVDESVAMVAECLIDKVEEDPLQTAYKSEDVYGSDGWNSGMIFPCRICAVEFQTKFKLMRHSVVHLDYRPFICECGRRFARKCGLGIHRNSSKHATYTIDEAFDGNYTCCVCGEKFNSSSELLRHNKSYLKYLHECECEKTFSKKMNLTMHKKTCRHKASWKSNRDDLSANFCRICGEKFVTNSELSRHYSKHIRYRPYVCECGMEFTKKKILNTHQTKRNHGSYKIKTVIKMEDGTETIRIIEDVERKSGCCICGRVFSNANAFQRHMRLHVKFRMIVCECGKEFVSKNHLLRHRNVSKHVRFRIKTKSEAAKRNLRGKMSTNKFALRCKHCGKVFKTWQALQIHMSIHTGEKPFSCNICKKKFARYTGLTYHMNSIHEKIPQYSCNVCGKGFYAKYKLKNHLETHGPQNDESIFIKHEDIKMENDMYTPEVSQYRCEQCDAVFPKLIAFQKHMMIHTGEKTYYCHICQKKFARFTGLTYHMDSIHERKPKHPCDVCGKGFYAKYKLKMHLETHKPRLDKTKCHVCNEDFIEDRCKCCESSDNITDTNYLFVCECGKAFVNRDFFVKHRKLNEHVKYQIKSDIGGAENTEEVTEVDESKKPRCGQCGKVFATPSALQKHMPVHTGVKTFSCNICQRVFSRYTGLTYHMNSVHEKVPKYTCAVCGKGFYMKYKLRLHLEAHSHQDDLKCHICNEDFIENRCKCCETVDSVTNNSLVFVCECEKVFVYRTFFVRHRKESNHIKYRIKEGGDRKNISDEMENESKYRCEKCEKHFTSYVLFKRHISTHVTTHNFSCNICDKKLSSLTKLVYHMKMQHGTMPNNLSEKSTAYYNQQNFTCDICGKSYYLKHMLNNHLKSHSQERNLLCNQCGATFYDIRYLRHHIANHSANKPYPCSHCDKQFMTRSRLRRHLNQCHLNVKPYVCDICNEGFVDVNGLKNHKIRHSNDRPYFCPVCSATFKSKSHVKRHLRNKVCAELGKDTPLRKRKEAT